MSMVQLQYNLDKKNEGAGGAQSDLSVCWIGGYSYAVSEFKLEIESPREGLLELGPPPIGNQPYLYQFEYSFFVNG